MGGGTLPRPPKAFDQKGTDTETPLFAGFAGMGGMMHRGGHMRVNDVVVHIHGAVRLAATETIAGHIAEAYERLASPPRALLEVRLVDSRARMAEVVVADKA